ncbi:hypothetical protein BDN71DRAFT_1512398 [Pleurotus eryngii]|uniref:Uncharacterized protein n=1 Tax=Pleurotus eryngii TaxID=5323 RepID=A0A9P5ZKH5_PLEER|nr:hypothetical protein BDN71DRAFT_1512398 [Pleurotus eryngii]
MSSSPIIIAAPLPSSDESMILWLISAPQKKFLRVAPTPLFGYSDHQNPSSSALESAFIKKDLANFWPILFAKWFKQWLENTEGCKFIEEQLKLWLLNSNKWQLSVVQKRFLKDMVPDFKAYQTSKKLPDFWACLFLEWFQQWPAAKTAPQALVEMKLRSCFNNNTCVMTNTRQVLNLNQPPKHIRLPTIYQTFCQVWWKKTLLDGTILCRVVHKEWAKEYKKQPFYNAALPIPRIPVTFMNTVSKQIFFKQSPLLQADILQRYENMKAEAVEEDEDDGDADAACARDFQMGIDSLPYSLEQVGEQILKRTGFILLTMVVGPDSSWGGNILAYRCVSITDEGQENALSLILQNLFSVTPEEQLRRALPGSEHLQNYKITTPAPTASQASNGTINPQLLMARCQSVDVEVDDSKSDISDSKFTTPTPPLGLNKARLGLNTSSGGPKDVGTVDTLNTSADTITAPNKAAVVPDADMTPDEAVIPNADTITTHNEAVAPNTEGDNGETEPATPLTNSANTVPTTEFNIYSVCPADAPLWLQAAVPYLLRKSKDSCWKSLVEHFMVFKRSLGYLDGKISSQILTIGKCRLNEMSVWVKSVRVIDPVIKNTLNFCQQWSYWYYKLQLAARKNGPNGLLQRVLPDNNDWTELCKGTINGVYGLMASLGWWLEAAKVDGGCKDTLTKALEDFEWALENMVQVNGHKRKSAKSDDADVPFKKSCTN